MACVSLFLSCPFTKRQPQWLALFLCFVRWVDVPGVAFFLSLV